MSSTLSNTFPAPVGGVPLDLDFAPSVLFAVLYVFATQLAIYRLARPSSRTLCTVASLIFTVERIVTWGLRAAHAHDPPDSISKRLIQYWQTTFTTGYLAIFADLIAITRSILVDAARHSSQTENQIKVEVVHLEDKDKDSAVESQEHVPSRPYGEEEPHIPILYRRVFHALHIFSLVPLITGIVAGSKYHAAETDVSTAQLVQVLRYIAASTACALVLTLQASNIWAYYCVPNVRRNGIRFVISVGTLINVISVYRLIVMRLKTTSVASLGPHSLNNRASKVTFYVFEAAPEFIAASIIFFVNIRQSFGVGLYRFGRLRPKSGQSKE